MPYYITDKNADCDGWAVVDGGDGFYGCHITKQEAIDQMVAISIEEDIEPAGERKKHKMKSKKPSYRELPENYRPALADDVPKGRACGNCYFFNEDRVNETGDKAWCEKWDDFVDGGYYCNAWQEYEEERAKPEDLAVGDFVSWNSSGGRARGKIKSILRDGELDVPDTDFKISASAENPAALIQIFREGADGWAGTDVLVGHKFSTLTKIADLDSSRGLDLEDRAVNLTPPAFMRAAARQGLRYYEEGLGGDGLVDATIREARAMAAGNVTADKWVRMGAWIARHTSDLDAPAANPSNDGYPSAGVVAHLLWGSGPSKRSAQRALAYANRVKAKLEEENRAKISVESESMAKVEQRISVSEFEIREDETGMTFEGYAAIFDSPSEPLPFIERIKRGAFNRSLKQARNDIKLLWNHDTSAVLGSTRAGTLKLVEDDKGLRVSATLPNTTSGRDAAVLLKRGDVDSMSFGFSVPAGGDTWNQEGTERTLKSVRLHEVSIVAFPAYTSTAGTTSVRGLTALAERAAVDVDQLADAMLLLEEGKDLTPEAADLLRTVIQELSPLAIVMPEIEEDMGNMEMLELKKTKLKLMEM
jgi:HK97 family phage prohead protease